MSQEILAAFVAESEELFEGIEEAVRDLEAGGEGAIDRLFRYVHTLKGSAGIVGLERLEAFAHEWESRLGRIRGTKDRLGPDCYASLMACRDHAVRILSEGEPAIGAEGAPQDSSPGVMLQAQDLVLLEGLDSALGTLAVSAAIAPSGSASDALRQWREARKAEVEKRMSGNSRAKQVDAVARIPNAKLERILSLSSEIVVALSNLAQATRLAGADSLLDEVSSLESLAANLYKNVLQTRMLPFGDMAGRYLRTVEEIAKQTGKKIRFVLSGSETEIDKSLADRMVEPLLHLIRNAADHGIESPVERVAAGKEAEGVIALRARRESGLLSIRIEDDGRGIDPETVRAKAIESGRIGTEDKLDEEELLDLLFEPGFTLSSSVTKWSGRGVGLDAVKKAVLASRGTVRLESRPGGGSAAVVRLPLALSLVEGFVAKAGDLVLLVPFDATSSCLEFRDTEFDRASFRAVAIGDRLIPSVDLGVLYGTGHGKERRIAIILEDEGETTGLIVDEVSETLSAAVRPLDRRIADSPGISGSAILGDGSMVLVLDTAELGRMAAKGRVATSSF